MFSLKKLKNLNPKNLTLKDLKTYSPIIVMVIITLVKMYMKKKKEQDPDYKPTLVLKQDGTYIEGFEDTMSNSLISTVGVLGVNDDVSSSTNKLLHIGSINPPDKSKNEFKSLIIDVYPKNAQESYRQTFGILLSGNTKEDIHLFKKSHFKNLYDESGDYTAYPGNLNGFYGLGIIKNGQAHNKGHNGVELLGKFDTLEECKEAAKRRNLSGFVYHKPEYSWKIWSKTCYTFGNRTDDEVIEWGKKYGRDPNIQTYFKTRIAEFTDIFDYIDITLNNTNGNVEVFLKISDSVNTIKDIPVVYYGSGLNKNTDSVLVNNSTQSPLYQISSLITSNYKNFDYTVYPKDFIKKEVNDLLIKAKAVDAKAQSIDPASSNSIDLYKKIAIELNKDFGLSYDKSNDRYIINRKFRLSQKDNFQSKLRFNTTGTNFYTMSLNKDDSTFNLLYNDDVNNGYVLHHSGTNEFRIPLVKDGSNNQTNGLTVSNKWRFSIDETKKTLDIYQNNKKDFRLPIKDDPHAYQRGMPGNNNQRINTMDASKRTYGIGNIEGFGNMECIHNNRNSDKSCSFGHFNEYRYFIGTDKNSNATNQYLKIGKMPLGTKSMLNIELYPNSVTSGFSRHSIFVYTDGISYKCINELHYGSGDLLYYNNGKLEKKLVGNETKPFKPYNWTTQDNTRISNGESEESVCESSGNRVYKGKVAEGKYTGCGTMKCCETNNYLPSISNVYLEKENNSINIYFKCNYAKANNYPVIYRYTLDENTTDFELLNNNTGTLKNNLTNSREGKIVEKFVYNTDYDTENMIKDKYKELESSFKRAKRIQNQIVGKKANILSIEQNNRAQIKVKTSSGEEIYQLDNAWDKSKGGYKILKNNNHMYSGYATVIIFYDNKLYAKNVKEEWYVARNNENRWVKYSNTTYINKLKERIEKELAPSKNSFKDMARDIILQELLKLNPALKPFIRRDGDNITFDKPVYIQNNSIDIENGNKNFVMGIDKDSNLTGYFYGNPGRFMLRHHDLSLQLYNKVHITDKNNGHDILESREGNIRFENNGDLSLAIYDNGGVSFGSRLTRIPGNFFDMESEAFGYTMVANSVLEKFDFDSPIYYIYRRGFIKYDGKLYTVKNDAGKYQHKSNRQSLKMLSNTMTNSKAITGSYPHKFVKINDMKLPKWSMGIPFMGKNINGSDGAISMGYYRIMNDQNNVLQHDGRNVRYVSINKARLRIPQEQPDSVWQLIKLNNDRVFFLNLVRVSVLNCWNHRWGTRNKDCGFNNGCYGEYFHLPGMFQKNGKDVKQYFSDYNKSVNSKNANMGTKRVPWRGWGEEDTYFHIDKGYVFKSLSLEQASCPQPSIERQTNNSNKLGTCPDGWRRGNQNHQCYKPDNGYNQGRCDNPSYFSWNYGKSDWVRGCNTSWTNRDVLKANEVAGVGIPNGERTNNKKIRRVRLYHVRNDDEAFLHPSEIEVYDSNNNNIARDKQVNTSQLYSSSKPASSVVDGNTSGTWDNGNCCVHTKAGKDVFIEVDLGAEYNVSKIKIYNRDNSNNCGQCSRRMDNARVRCLDNNNKVVLDFNTGVNWNNDPREFLLSSSIKITMASKHNNSYWQDLTGSANGGVVTFKLPENPANSDTETNLFLHPDIHGSRFKIPQQTPGCNVKLYKNRGVSGHVVLEELEYIPQIKNALKQTENFENLVKEQKEQNIQDTSNTQKIKAKSLYEEVKAGNEYTLDNIMNINNTEKIEGFTSDEELSSNSIVDSYIGLNTASPGKKHIKVALLKVDKDEEKSLTIEMYPSKKDISATKQVLSLILSNHGGKSEEFIFLYNTSGDKEYKNFENINVYKKSGIGSLVEYTITMETRDVDHPNKSSDMPVRYILNNVILNDKPDSDYIIKENSTQTIDVSTLGTVVPIKYIMEPNYSQEFETSVLEKKRVINDVFKLFDENLKCPEGQTMDKCLVFQEIIQETLDLLSMETVGTGNNKTLKIKNKNLIFLKGLYLLNGSSAYEMNVDSNNQFGIRDFNNNSLYNPNGKTGANLVMDGSKSSVGTTAWGGLNMNNWSFQDWGGFRISKIRDIYTGSMQPEYHNYYSSGCASCGNVGTNGNWGCRTFDNLKDAAEECIKCNSCNAVTRWKDQYQLRSSNNINNSSNNESTWLKNYPNVKNSKRKIWKNTIIKLYEGGGMVLRSVDHTNTGHVNYSYYWGHADTPKAKGPYRYKIGYNDNEHDNV